MPGVVNVCLKVSPSPRVGLPNAPPSSVTVWAALSALVHLTVDPCGTVRFAGAKTKSTIEAATVPVPGGDVGFGDVFGVGAGVVVGRWVGCGVVESEAAGFGVGRGVAAVLDVGAGRAVAVGPGVKTGVRLADPLGIALGAAVPAMP